MRAHETARPSGMPLTHRETPEQGHLAVSLTFAEHLYPAVGRAVLTLGHTYLVSDEELYRQFWRSLPPTTQGWLREHPESPLPQGVAFELDRRPPGFVTIIETSQGTTFTLPDEVWDWIERYADHN